MSLSVDSIEAVSLEPPQTESLWLERELGITWKQHRRDDLRQLLFARMNEGLRTVVIATPRSADALSDTELPRDSIVLLLLSDEQYASECSRLVRLPAVHKCFRQYSTDLVESQRWIGLALQHLLAGLLSPRTALQRVRDLARGFSSRRRVRAWKALAHSEELPLGYSGSFGNRAAASDTGTPLGKRSLTISFSGQRGCLQRQEGLRLAAEIPNSWITVAFTPWLGDAGGWRVDQYAALALTSTFSLCPPGWVCNESFRVEEALLSGSMPVGLTVAVRQGTRSVRLQELGIFRASWRKALREMKRMTGEEVLQYHDLAARALASSWLEARVAIDRALSDATVLQT